jgi:glutathione synthase/RimK-type ligase-like ATP-grasp enzyme
MMIVRSPINIIKGIPDDRRAGARAPKQDARLKIQLRGTACLEDHIPDKYFEKTILYLDPDPVAQAPTFARGPLLNHIADPDLCGKALEKLEGIVRQSQRACFNHPMAVLATFRDVVSHRLSDIANLVVPKTIRLVAEGPASIEKTILGSELSYPVLVRIAGDHGGASTIKIDKADHLPETYKLNCYRKPIYVTEFYDFVSPDGRYRKFRVAVIGDKIVLRHMLVGDNWLLHAQRRGDATEIEEQQVLECFNDEIAPRVYPIFMEIANRLDLDYFGVDCNISESGQVTLFEANACMNILANSAPPPNMWEKPIENIQRALFVLLSSPRRWRHSALLGADRTPA